MQQAGELRVSGRGQMSLPASARNRWGLEHGGQVGYLDLGDALLVIPGGVEALRSDLLAAITEDHWAEAATGFGDLELATQ
jgi:hypothetical protein